MSAQELQQIEQDIQDLRAQLAGLRSQLAKAPPEHEVRFEQLIRDKRQKIRTFEQQKWELIAEMTAGLQISEEEAEPVVAEIVTEVQAISVQTPVAMSAEILDMLQKILAKLNEPEKSAAAKLRGVISMLPPFVSLSYEAELDTESTFQRYLPTFSSWIREARDRLKK